MIGIVDKTADEIIIKEKNSCITECFKKRYGIV